MSTIPFEIPQQFAARIADGSLERIGALIKDVSTGQIVAHVQETGVGRQLLDSFSCSFFSPLDAVSGIVANAQLVQLKHMIEGLQVLQFATLGATLVGVGVSAAGFVVLNKKLSALSNQIEDVRKDVRAEFSLQHERGVQTHFSTVRGLFEQADEAVALRKPEEEWRAIARELANEGAFFRAEVRMCLSMDVFDQQLFAALLQALATCHGGRLECLLLSNELHAARKVALNISRQYHVLFDAISPRTLMDKVREPGATGESSYGDQLREMRQLLSSVRDIQDAAHTKPLLIDTMIARGIDGNRYVRQLREDESEPLVLLPAQ